MIGKTIGPYQVLDKLGEGGMGEVYRARDPKLNRDVAIKVLPERLAADPDRVARFEREAQALAALNHPNIAAIYGVEERAIVMEFVPGRTLDDVIRAGIDREEAIRIATAIADAVEAAHSAAIVHRDLKPANVKVRDDGTVKVLDFGLARMTGPDAAAGSAEAQNSPTRTTPAMTRQGIILGTAAYMAPEQARGRPVDKRADIWAFGCVLYEMLVRRPAFAGDTVTDLLAAVVTRDPDWSALPADTPRSIRAVLKRCLQKDPKQRLHDIADARIELASSAEDTAIETASPPPLRARVPAWALAATAVAVLAAGIAAGVLWQASRQTPPVEWTASRLGGPAVAYSPRISPDGHLLAFIAEVEGLSQVAVMKPGRGGWTVITHDRSQGLVYGLNWSADSGHVYYDRTTDVANGIFSVPNLGGEERLVLENAGNPLPLSDGSLLFGRANSDRVWQLHRFFSSTGKIEALPFVRTSQWLGAQNLSGQIDADHVAIVGRPLSVKGAEDGLYLLNLRSFAARRIGSDIDMTSALTLTTDPADRSVLLSVREPTTTYRVWRVPTDAARASEPMLMFLSEPELTIARNGPLYMSLHDRPLEVVRFSDTGAAPERLITGPTLTRSVVPMRDDRILLNSRVGGRSRVIVWEPRKEPVNLVQTDEETRAPVTPVGTDRVAVMIGSPETPEIAIVSVTTGRLVSRFPVPPGITSLGASPDGQTLYFAAAGKISAMPVGGGAPRPIGSGDSLVVDPDTGDLIVKLDEAAGSRLARLPAAGGTSQPIAIDSKELRLIPEPLSPGSIHKGRLVLPVGTKDSWNWFVALLDLPTGRLTRVPVDYDTDFHFASWSPAGRIIGTGLGMQAGLWRFEKTTRSDPR